VLGFDLRKRRQYGIGQQGISSRHVRSGGKVQVNLGDAQPGENQVAA
jgi:hypothetical protein